MTLGRIYKKIVLELSSASLTPELDARILIDFVIQKESSLLLSHPETPLTNAQYSRIRRLINRRKKGEPIAYLTGHKEFYGLDFFVNKNVLIPRPETENLIAEAIKFTSSRLSVASSPQATNHKPLTVLDMGTGSGCMIIHLAKKLDELYNFITFNFFASDISQSALRVAKKNARRLLFDSRRSEVENSSRFSTSSNNIKFVHSDLFRNRILHKKFDLIIANLPYVPLSDCHFDSRRGEVDLPAGRQGNLVRSLDSARDDRGIDFEPRIAIFAGDNGTAVIKRFLSDARNRLTPHGAILLELDPRNAKELDNYAKKLYPSAKVELFKDLAKRERYLKIRPFD